MRFFILAFSLFICTSCFSQTIQPDSVNKKRDSVTDVIKVPADTSHHVKIEYHQDEEGLKQLLQQMKDRENQEKRLAYVRIGLGVAFLAVLIIGLSRRRKRKTP